MNKIIMAVLVAIGFFGLIYVSPEISNARSKGAPATPPVTSVKRVRVPVTIIPKRHSRVTPTVQPGTKEVRGTASQNGGRTKN